jgi:uncharacterized protein (TIGR03083 family)
MSTSEAGAGASPLPTAPVDAGVGRAVYLNAVASLVAVGQQLGPADWETPSACAGWSCRDLVGHVLCVVRWHHEWLDRASHGDPWSAWPASELADRNQEALDHLELSDGPSRLAAYEESAHHYADQLELSWSRAYSFPGGSMTTGLHALLAAGEWHLHAWDLAWAFDLTPRPAPPEVRDAWLVLGRDVSIDLEPWTAILQASGRE